jgi:hypothetical protein
MPEFDRPTTVETICERLARGEALAAICRSRRMPTTRTFLRWAADDEAVAAEYSRALEARAEWAVAEHERIRRTAVDKESAAAARVQLSALEWQMSKMAPKRYGDRIDLNVDHSFDLAAALTKGRERVLEANARFGLPAPSKVCE